MHYFTTQNLCHRNSVMVKCSSNSASKWKFRCQNRETDALEEVGDVIAATGRPDEGVGLHGDVGGHEFCGLLTAHSTRIANTIVIHSEPVKKMNDGTVEWTPVWHHKKHAILLLLIYFPCAKIPQYQSH